MRRVRIKDDALEQRIFLQRAMLAAGLVVALVLLGLCLLLFIALERGLGGHGSA